MFLSMSGKANGRLLFAVLALLVGSQIAAQDSPANAKAERPALADQVTIYRDEWGAPHVWGKTNLATVFGQGYAQAEDYFWQIEDNCIRALGRYAEVAGESALSGDVLSRSFEVERRSKEDFPKLDKFHQDAMKAFTDGCLLYTSPSPRDKRQSRMPSSA